MPAAGPTPVKPAAAMVTATVESAVMPSLPGVRRHPAIMMMVMMMPVMMLLRWLTIRGGVIGIRVNGINRPEPADPVSRITRAAPTTMARREPGHDNHDKCPDDEDSNQCSHILD